MDEKLLEVGDRGLFVEFGATKYSLYWMYKGDIYGPARAFQYMENSAKPARVCTHHYLFETHFWGDWVVYKDSRENLCKALTRVTANRDGEPMLARNHSSLLRGYRGGRRKHVYRDWETNNGE